ncbi:MAG TPA: ATP-binding protein [Phototrophicaceae bacterium]|nr:ATP-binding protein [Phototrophicaceae bacterium]
MYQDWLYRIARALHYQGLNSQDVLHTALSMICTAIDVTQACVLTFDDDGDVSYFFLLETRLQDQRELWDRLMEEGLVGFVQHEQRIINFRDIGAEPRWSALIGAQRGSVIGVPLMHHTTLIGALMMLHPEIDHFNDEVSDFLEEASGLIGAAYDNARRAEQLKAEADDSNTRMEQLKRDYAETAQVDQLRRDLSAMTYHDLRGLLQNIYSSLSGVERAVSADRAARNLLKLATQSTRQMTRMVKGLLDIERLEQGSAVINRRRTALHPLLDDILELVRPIATDADQELAVEVIEPLPDVQIDADMITRVLVNLVENAVKHTPPGGRVTLRVRAKRDVVYFSVSDTGSGIPLTHMKEIFDKYYRIRHADAPPGVGLGLAFCRLAVEAHGGQIWVENQPESGAMFTFTLPPEPVATAAQV